MGPTLGPPIDRYARRREQGQRLAGSMQDFFRNQEEVEALKKYGVDTKGLSPDQRQQVLAQQLKMGAKEKYAEATKRHPLDNSFTDERYERGEPVEFMGRKKSRFDLESSPLMNKGTGNVPKPQAKGDIQPLMTPQEIIHEGSRRGEMARSMGVPITDQEATQQVIQEQGVVKDHNEQVELDRQRRIQAQEKNGAIAEGILKKVLPDASDEITANFMRKGELAGESGESEAELKKSLAKEAAKFKNTIANVKKNIPPSSGLTGIKKKFLGTGRSWDKEKVGLRQSVNPLLKEGLYDTARSLLSEKGYMPEEVESIITDLPEGAMKTMSQFPKIPKPIPKTAAEARGRLLPVYTEQQKDLINDTVLNVFKGDPSTNLILLRKEFEDKGVDWAAYKDAIDYGISTGQIQLNDDQYNHLTDLNDPPLDKLDEWLHLIGWIGR